MVLWFGVDYNFVSCLSGSSLNQRIHRVQNFILKFPCTLGRPLDILLEILYWSWTWQVTKFVLSSLQVWVDVESVDHQDLKGDDLGSWHSTRTKKSYFWFSPDGTLRMSDNCPGSVLSAYYILIHRYYIHKSYDKYHQQITDIKGKP